MQGRTVNSKRRFPYMYFFIFAETLVAMCYDVDFLPMKLRSGSCYDADFQVPG